MLINTPSIEQLSNVISQVTGPAFLLAAEAQLLSVLVSRLDRIVDRARSIVQTDGDSAAQVHLKAELPILRKRGLLMHHAMYWGVASCIVTSVLVILSFAAAYFMCAMSMARGCCSPWRWRSSPPRWSPSRENCSLDIWRLAAALSLPKDPRENRIHMFEVVREVEERVQFRRR